MKKIIFINFFIFIFIILFLEFTFNFFKLSGLMGIQSGLIYEKNGFHFLSPNTSGTVFGKKVYTDKYGFRVPNSTFQYDNKKNILIIGDSTTFGNGVIEEEGLTVSELPQVERLWVGNSVQGVWPVCELLDTQGGLIATWPVLAGPDPLQGEAHRLLGYPSVFPASESK